MRRWRQENPEAARERKRLYEQTHPEKMRAKRHRYRRAHPEKAREIEGRRDPREGRKRALRRYHAVKDAVLDHYSRACSCCGATDRLTIDHVNGDGKAHRIELFGRSSANLQMYRWLIAQGFPPGFQVLCRPCNSSKGAGAACRLDHATGSH
jgi:hypothetical protein